MITIHLLYNQHLTDDAKQLYNETLIRALKQEYELINNEKNYYLDKYNILEEKHFNELKFNENKFNQLQNKYDNLLDQNEFERLHGKQALDDLTHKYELHEKQLEFNIYDLHRENEILKCNFNNLEENYRKLIDKNYENEYQQLRKDYNDLIEENELLKDYNSQIYQQKLQKHEDNNGMNNFFFVLFFFFFFQTKNIKTSNK